MVIICLASSCSAIMNEAISDDEKEKLNVAHRQAEQYERRELLRQPLEGCLMKFTNVVKGWQYRYFVVDPKAGELRLALNAW